MNIIISYESEDKLALDYEEIIGRVVREAMRQEGCPYEAEVSVLLTDDDEIRSINSQFRFIDNTTDVLSFPMVNYNKPGDFSVLEEDGSDFCFDPESGDLLLGDIAISVQKVREQAKNYGHSEERELAFLVAHSMFHLMGYDHEEEFDRLTMEEKQRRVLEELGISR